MAKTVSFGIRLSNSTYKEIERLIQESPKQQANSVTEYCQECIECYVWRHSIRKFRRK